MKYVIYIAVGLITAISLFTACEKEDVVPQGDVQMTDVDRFIASEAYQAYSKVKETMLMLMCKNILPFQKRNKRTC